MQDRRLLKPAVSPTTEDAAPESPDHTAGAQAMPQAKDAPGRAASLLVVGVGIQWGAQTTAEARRAIEGADQVLFAVSDPLAARFVRALHPRAEALPYAAPGEPRLPAYQAIVDRLLAALHRGGSVCAVFYGDPSFMTYPAHHAVRSARAAGFVAQMLPGVSALACLCADLGVDPGQRGLQIYEATDFLRRRPRFDTGVPLILCQVGWIGQRVGFDARQVDKVQQGLAALQTSLGAHYPGAHPATIYEAASHPLAPPRVLTVPVEALAQAEVSDCATLFLPAVVTSGDVTLGPDQATPDKEDLR